MSALLIRWSGPATMLGGLLLIVVAMVHAARPEGCVGDDCSLPGRSMRAGGAFDGLLLFAAVALIGIGVTALVLLARRAGRFGKLGTAGLLCAAAGVALLLGGIVVQAALFGGDFPYMPLVVLPGGLALMIGLLLVGIAVLRAGVLPRWSAALLIACTLLMVGFNEQDQRALLAVPFGLAWVGVGFALMAGR